MDVAAERRRRVENRTWELLQLNLLILMWLQVLLLALILWRVW
jgi:hypothetical protein